MTPHPPVPRIRCHALSVHFGDRPALSAIDLDIFAGETVSLLGPNGAGKSTLLRVIAGLLPPTHGEARYEGRLIDRVSPSIVYVPQRSSVDWTFPASVMDVVLMARARNRTRWLPYGRTERERAGAALAQVQMEPFAGVQIGQLSGGQQQRVFLARALLQQGEVLLLDEPFAGVDLPTQELLVTLFAGLRNQGRTIVAASHDLTQAAAMSDRVVLLNRTLIATGPPAAVMTTTHLRAAFGGMVFLPLDRPAEVGA